MRFCSLMGFTFVFFCISFLHGAQDNFLKWDLENISDFQLAKNNTGQEDFAFFASFLRKEPPTRIDLAQPILRFSEITQIQSLGQQGESKSYDILLILFLSFLFILFVVIYVLYRQKITNSEQQAELLEYNAKINKSNAKLNEAINELDRFTSHVAHDIKSSIIALQKGIQSIKYSNDSLDKESLVVLNELEKETNDLCDFVDFLLQKAKKDQNKYSTSKEFELIDVISKVINNLSKSYDLSDFDINYDWKLPRFIGESLPVFQLLKNLLENAIKYRSEDKRLVIDMELEKENAMLTITVKDNGRGIPQKKQKEIFDIFRQSHKADQFIGTGVGLSICKSIVDEYNGTIGVHSVEGEGTTFTAVLNERAQALP